MTLRSSLLLTFFVFIGLGCEPSVETSVPEKSEKPLLPSPPLGGVSTVTFDRGVYSVHLTDSAQAFMHAATFADSAYLKITFGDTQKIGFFYLPTVRDTGTYTLQHDQRHGEFTSLIKGRYWYSSSHGNLRITEYSWDGKFVSGQFTTTLTPVSGSTSDSILIDGQFNRIPLDRD